MFGLITNAVEGVLSTTADVVDGLLDGDLPSSRQVAQLVDAGLTIAAVSAACGVSEEVIEKLLEDE